MTLLLGELVIICADCVTLSLSLCVSLSLCLSLSLSLSVSLSLSLPLTVKWTLTTNGCRSKHQQTCFPPVWASLHRSLSTKSSDSDASSGAWPALGTVRILFSTPLLPALTASSHFLSSGAWSYPRSLLAVVYEKPFAVPAIGAGHRTSRVSTVQHISAAHVDVSQNPTEGDRHRSCAPRFTRTTVPRPPRLNN